MKIKSSGNCWIRLKDWIGLKSKSIDDQEIVENPLLGWTKIKPDAGGLIHWHLVNFPKSMEKGKVLAEFNSVFEEWQNIMDRVEPFGRYLTYQSTSSIEKAHIQFIFADAGKMIQRIRCADGKVRSYYIPKMMDGVGGVLAYVPEYELTVYFDDSENWVDLHSDLDTGISLFNVVLHELFHIHDLKHSKERNSIRNPYYNGETKKATNKDIQDLGLAYGPIKEKFKSDAV